MKTCSKCGIEKCESEFAKQRAQCKTCKLLYGKEYSKKRREIHGEVVREIDRKWYSKNKKIKRLRGIQYRNNNAEIIKKKKQKYVATHRKEINDRNKIKYKKYKNDPIYRMKSSVSALIRYYLSSNGHSKNGKSCKKYLSYSFQELKEHLEKQFEPWMNWNNRGNYDPKTWNDNDQSTWTWNLDHIIPQSKLPYTSMEDDNFKKCWALSNLRPYSAKQNVFDGNRR